MGIRSIEPWANDLAADWFSELFEQTGLAGKVESTLQLAPAEHVEESGLRRTFWSNLVDRMSGPSINWPGT